MLLQAILREGETGTLTYTGAPGDLVLGMTSLSQDNTVLSGEQGVLHLSFPLAATVYLGNASTGTLNVPFGVPELGPGIDALPVFVQALVQDDDGLKLSAPSMTLLVDGSL